MAGDAALGLPPIEPLEVCSGVVVGRRRSPCSASGRPAKHSTVRGVLEDLLIPALRMDPCFMSFSGGRDSAALLSFGTRLARERGLSDPVPVTIRITNRPASYESDWQEITIDHLGLRRWEIVTIGDELDPLGPLATKALRRHGLYWPPVAHRIMPLLEVARGHVIVFGTGGDEVFSPWGRHAALEKLDVRGRPFRQTVKRAAFNLLPERLRIYVRLRRYRDLPWLRPAARRELERKYRALLRQQRSLTWAEAIGRIPESRTIELTQAIFTTLARDAEVSVVQPFLDPGFIRAVGESAPRQGFPSRAAVMELHFGDVLPPQIVQRTTKAEFDELQGGTETRAFAQAWDGRGLDPTWVDVEALRGEWLSPRPAYRSLTALNAAWLASESAPR